MVRDYKITTNVNKQAYLLLRRKFLMEGSSFAEWLDKKIEEENKKPTELEKSINKMAGIPKVSLGIVPETATEKRIGNPHTSTYDPESWCKHMKKYKDCTLVH